MGLHLPGNPGPERAAAKRTRRAALVAVVVGGALLLAGCSSDSAASRFAMPDPRTEQGEHILTLWQGAWVAALITGAIVWGLIFWVIWRYRRRSDRDIPVQTRYNLPLEIFYTIAPVFMVIVFFAHTVEVQNEVLDDDLEPDNVIEVVGQQWQWTFNYGVGSPDNSADEALDDDEYAYSEYVYDVGTMSHIPTLVLPAHTTTRFNLHSADVIHSFGVPDFNMKMDVVPGRVNHFAVTTKEATAEFDPGAEDLLSGDTFRGACYELCGLYHGRMIFKVAIVSESDYESYLAEVGERGFVTEDGPYLGGGKSTLSPEPQSETEGDAA